MGIRYDKGAIVECTDQPTGKIRILLVYTARIDCNERPRRPHIGQAGGVSPCCESGRLCRLSDASRQNTHSNLVGCCRGGRFDESVCDTEVADGCAAKFSEETKIPRGFSFHNAEAGNRISQSIKYGRKSSCDDRVWVRATESN